MAFWDRKLPVITADALFDIENALAEPKFQGVSLGSTLGDIFLIEFYNGQGNWNIKSRFKQRLSYWRHLYIPRKKPRIGLPTNTGRYLITWLADTPKLNELVLPVVESLEEGKCFVVGATESMRAKLHNDSDFMTFTDIPSVDLGTWRREFRLCSRKLKHSLTAVLKKHSIPLFVQVRLMDALVINSQRVMAYGRLLEAVQPRAVITEFDRNNHASCLVLAAKNRGIPTMTMVHGVINPPYGYTPLLADYAFCWGGQQRDVLVSLGVPSERLVVTGYPRLQRAIFADRESARAKVGLSNDRPLILLATNPVDPDNRHRLVKAFCDTLKQDISYLGVVRLHPSEHLDFYREYIEKFPGILFLENNAWTVDESVIAADVIVCHDTGFGFDALIKGRVVVVFDVLDFPLSSSRDLVDKAGCPVAKCSDELLHVIGQLRDDYDYQQKVIANASEFISYFCAAFGVQAARNIADVIKKLVHA